MAGRSLPLMGKGLGLVAVLALGCLSMALILSAQVCHHPLLPVAAPLLAGTRRAGLT